MATPSASIAAAITASQSKIDGDSSRGGSHLVKTKLDLPKTQIVVDLDKADDIVKYRRYESDYTSWLMAKYFSSKTIHGGDMFEEKVIVNGETIKASRWSCTSTYSPSIKDSTHQAAAAAAAEIETAISAAAEIVMMQERVQATCASGPSALSPIPEASPTQGEGSSHSQVESSERRSPSPPYEGPKFDYDHRDIKLDRDQLTTQVTSDLLGECMKEQSILRKELATTQEVKAAEELSWKIEEKLKAAEEVMRKMQAQMESNWAEKKLDALSHQLKVGEAALKRAKADMVQYIESLDHQVKAVDHNFPFHKGTLQGEEPSAPK